MLCSPPLPQRHCIIVKYSWAQKQSNKTSVASEISEVGGDAGKKIILLPGNKQKPSNGSLI
jgi:hypothetical protein